MVTTTMKTIRLIVLLLAAITITSASVAQTASKPPKNAKPAAGLTQTNQAALTNQTVFCCRHANRIFGDHTTVNLTPLFQWWKSHAPANGSAASDTTTAAADSSRPLSAWCRITGTKIGFAGSGYDWLVDAVVYTSPTTHTAEHIILKNPPTTEEQSFNNLKNVIAVDSLQITNDLQTYKAETAAAQKVAAKKSSTKKGKRSNNNGNAQQAAQDRDAAAAALENQKQLEAELALAQKQFDAIPAVKGKYQIDWFAVAVGKDPKGVPIYDVGVVDPNSP